jgi:hypothetical protein
MTAAELRPTRGWEDDCDLCGKPFGCGEGHCTGHSAEEESEMRERTRPVDDPEAKGSAPKRRFVKLPPELYDGQHHTFVDADAQGMGLLGQRLAEWLTDAEPAHGDKLELELVEMTQEEFDAIPEC